MTELLPLVTEPAEPAEPATEVDRIPLALQQDFLRMMDSGSESGPFGPRYTIVAGWRVLGEIDVDTVRRAAEDVVARHETLRTRIVLDDGDPYQHVLPPSPPEVLIRDLTEQGRGDRDLAVEEFLNEIESGVSVSNGTPRVKVALGRFDPWDSVLVFMAHHTVVDGASVHVLMRDFAASYAARRERRAPDFPQVRQYREYVAWQQANATGAEVTAAREFWRDYLRGARMLPVPTDRPRSEGGYVTGWHRFMLEDELRLATLATAKRTRSSPFMVLTAAFLTLMRERTGETDLVVPTLMSGRYPGWTQPMVGVFYNFMPLRTDITGCTSFDEVVAKVRATCLTASPQRTRERPDVCHEGLGLLQSGEVTAAVELGPLRDRWQVALGELADREKDVVREDRDTDGNGDRRLLGPSRRADLAKALRVFVVQLSRRSGGRRQPVGRHDGEQQVAVDGVLGNRRRVRPLPELLDDPCELPDRRVGQAVRQRLRAGRLELHVCGQLGVESRQLPEARQVGLAQVGELCWIAGRERQKHVDVYPDDVFGIDPAQRERDHRAGVAALREVAVVAEAAHQLGPGLSHPLGAPAGAAVRPGEPEPGDGGNHQVERVGRVAAVAARVVQRPDDVEELCDAARPAVGDQQRAGVRLRRAHVEEVDVHSVDLGDELRVRVQPRLCLAPVVGGAPVLRQLLEVAERDAARPADAGQLIRPPGVRQPAL